MLRELPEIIRYHRKQSGLSQFELAKLAGTGKTAVFDLENGRVNTRLDTLFKVLGVLNITVNFQSSLMKDYRESRKLDEKH